MLSPFKPIHNDFGSLAPSTVRSPSSVSNPIPSDSSTATPQVALVALRADNDDDGVDSASNGDEDRNIGHDGSINTIYGV